MGAGGGHGRMARSRGAIRCRVSGATISASPLSKTWPPEGRPASVAELLQPRKGRQIAASRTETRTGQTRGASRLPLEDLGELGVGLAADARQRCRE